MGTRIASLAAISKVSHTLRAAMAGRLDLFAFRGRFSESAVIEAALEDFFGKAADKDLYAELHHRGYGRRRPSTYESEKT